MSAGSVKRQILLAKMESTYGTDSIPTGAANAILCEELSIVGLDLTVIERDYVITGFMKEMGVPAERVARISCSVDFVSGTTAAAPPSFGALLRACGLQEVITASTSVEYRPIATGFESVVLYGWEDGTLHKVTGARGTVSLEASAGKLPKLKFEMLGIFNAPGEVALPTTTYAAAPDPKPVKYQSTAFQVNVIALVLNNYSFQLGNSLVYRDRPNLATVDIDDRMSAGTMAVHKTALTTFDPFALAAAGTGVPIVLAQQLGGTRAAEMTIFAAQFDKPSYGRDGNQSLFQIPFKARRITASDVRLLFT